MRRTYPATPTVVQVGPPPTPHTQDPLVLRLDELEAELAKLKALWARKKEDR